MKVVFNITTSIKKRLPLELLLLSEFFMLRPVVRNYLISCYYYYLIGLLLLVTLVQSNVNNNIHIHTEDAFASCKADSHKPAVLHELCLMKYGKESLRLCFSHLIPGTNLLLVFLYTTIDDPCMQCWCHILSFNECVFRRCRRIVKVRG